MAVVIIDMQPVIEEPQRPAVAISWSDVTFKVKASKGMVAGEDGFTELIHGVSGFANPGQVLALMGGSGAGKTTLLNILSDRLANPKNTKITGKVLANGQDVKSIAYKTYIGYVMQDDILLDTMTPRECLQFSANMRVHGTAEQKKAKVEQLLEDLKLTSVANNRIGSVMIKGISGGERRRTSIGVELITNPSAVFLDGKQPLRTYLRTRQLHCLDRYERTELACEKWSDDFMHHSSTEYGYIQPVR